MKSNILVIAAHPDDEVLGCGGTLAKYVNEGHNVSVMILGEGLTSRDAKRQRAKRKEGLRLLKRQAKKANDLLGVKDISMYDLPDNRFDTVALLDIVKLIERQILKTKPEIIFTHTNCDLNIDHVITHQAVLTATRPMPGCIVKELYAFEISSSTEWAFQRFGPVFRPNVFVDITDTLNRKIKAMMIYEGELRKFPHPRSDGAMMALAKYRGSMAGIEAAEAFELMRKIAWKGS